MSNPKSNPRADELMSREMENKTDCGPDTNANSRSSNLASIRTQMGMDMPPVRSSSGISSRVRVEDHSYEQGQMRKSSRRKWALGAAVAGGLAAGAYALLRTRNTSDSSGQKASNSLAGWLPNGKPVTIRKRQEVNARPSTVYAEWRKLEKLPNILSHLKSVEVLDESRSRWCAKGPLATEVCWFANITHDEPGRLIAWQAEDKADVPNSGRVQFSETPQGNTLIEVTLTYQPPAGDLGRSFAAAFGENPEHQIEDDLKKFKLNIEKSKSSSTAKS